MGLILIFFLPVILLPTLIYFAFIMKKRYFDKDLRFANKRFTYFGYGILAVNLLTAAFFSGRFRSEYHVKQTQQLAAYERGLENETKLYSECAYKMNERKEQLTIKGIVRGFEANPDRSFNHLRVVVYNDYLGLHKHEQKQFLQLTTSLVKSICGKEHRIAIYDQMMNVL